MSAYTATESHRILSRTPDILTALLAGAAPAVIDSTEGEGTWSPRQVVGHLIDGERFNWLPRIRIFVERSGRTFEPFDRFRHLTAFADTPIDELLDVFRHERHGSLAAIASLALTEPDLELTATHPELGTVTLRQQLSTWVAHDLSHLTQITRVMAKRYAEDVGPWKAYLSVFRSAQRVAS